MSGGKDARLVVQAASLGLQIVCSTEEHAKSLKQLADHMGLKIPDPIVTEPYKCPMIEELFYDEADTIPLEVFFKFLKKQKEESEK